MSINFTTNELLVIRASLIQKRAHYASMHGRFDTMVRYRDWEHNGLTQEEAISSRDSWNHDWNETNDLIKKIESNLYE